MVMKFDYNQILENVQLNSMILAAAGEGVISGLDVSERGAGVNMSVDVATGSALIGGTTYTESSIVNLAISAADATHARKDLVIYDAATTNPLVVTGTPATPPTPPDITTGDILLAIVEVAANETEITNSEITDCIVEVVTGGALGGLADVAITAVAAGELIAYNSGGSNWINRTLAEAGIAALAGFTMAGTLNMGDYLIDDVDNLRAFDSNGIELENDAGTTMVRVGYNGYTKFYQKLDMTSYRIENLNDPSSAQDAATKNWIETSAVAYNAGKVDGCDAGVSAGNVFKIPADATGAIYQIQTGTYTLLSPGTSGYQLTSNGAGNALTWAAASDLIFSDTHCPKCGQELKDGDNLILHVIGHNEVGDILTIPMHLSCANEPKKTVMVQRKVMEDHFILNEETGELKVQRSQKTQKKTVTRHKLKEGYSIDDRTGTACKVKHRAAVHDLKEALEEIEETIEEPVYEDVEYLL